MFELQRTLGPIALLAITLTQSACSSLQPPTLPQPFDDDYAPIISYLSKLIPQEMKAGDLEGLSIALVDKQTLLWSEGFGNADKEQNVQATEQTRYRAGSVSKLFNAYAVMQLEEQGLLDLDVPVATYIPEFSINSRFGSTDNITLRTLISHQSGLPSDMANDMWSKNPPPLRSLLPALRDAYTVAPADTMFNYSNVGVSLSGLAVESVSGIPYEQYMQEAVLQPIGMEDSDFTGKLQGDRASPGYINGSSVAELALRDTPAGGLNTTVEDLAKFLMAVHASGQPLIQESSFQQMRTVQNEGRTLDLGQRVGLGWLFDSNPLGGRHDVLWHGGRTIAHTTMLSTVPELGIGVVIMTNSADATNALDRIARKAMQQLYITKGLPLSHSPDNDAVNPELDTSSELSGDFAGNFGLLSVNSAGERYSASAMGATFSLRPEEGHWFSPRVMLWFIPLRPKELKSVKVTQATIDERSRLIGQYEGDLFLLGDLIEPYPASDHWDRYLGQYNVRNPVEVPWMRTKDIYFKRAENYYLLEITGSDDQIVKMPIRPLNNKQLLILGTGRGLGDTLTFAGEPGESVFTLLGLVYQRVDATVASQ